jgi:enoyl reductase-like protein
MLYNIYKIYSDKCNLVYIGVSKDNLEERFKSHKINAKHKNYMSYKIFERDENSKIKLLETYPCESYKAVSSREQNWIYLYDKSPDYECVNYIKTHKPELSMDKWWHWYHKSLIYQYDNDFDASICLDKLEELP